MTDHGLVFTTPFGEPLDGSRLTERRLRPLMKTAGLPPIHFHDLRHTAATLMLSAGVNPKIVSENARPPERRDHARSVLTRHSDNAGGSRPPDGRAPRSPRLTGYESG